MRLPSPSPRRLSGRKTRSMNNRPSDVRPVMPPSTSFVSGSETTTASGRLSSMPDCRALKRRSPSPMAASTRASGASVTATRGSRSEEHTSELQSQSNLVCRLLLEKKNGHLVDNHVDTKFCKRRHHVGVKTRNRLPRQRELSLGAIAGRNAHAVINELDLDLKGVGA